MYIGVQSIEFKVSAHQNENNDIICLQTFDMECNSALHIRYQGISAL